MIKNYTSTSKQTFERIQKCLIDHKAKNISFEYDDTGKCSGIVFSTDIDGKIFGFKLPANYQKVQNIFQRQSKWQLDAKQKEQAYRTAWANIRDWIEAQMALIDTEMVKMEQVFLPYMIDSQGKTYFEHLESKQFLLEEAKEK